MILAVVAIFQMNQDRVNRTGLGVRVRTYEYAKMTKNRTSHVREAYDLDFKIVLNFVR